MADPEGDPAEHDNQISWNVSLDQEKADTPLELEPYYQPRIGS